MKGAALLGPAERVAFGRLGGSIKCPKGLAMYSPEQRAENARRGSLARWARYRALQDPTLRRSTDESN